AGDIFQLGNLSWRIQQVVRGTVRVEDARGQPPNIPFWLGEAPARSRELSSAVGDLREEVETGLEGEHRQTERGDTRPEYTGNSGASGRRGAGEAGVGG